MDTVEVSPANAEFLRETEEFLHSRIPITRMMGVKVEECDAEKLVLSAPLGINHNHLGTAFGGSLASVAVLAGYGFLWTRIVNRDCHIVIRDSSTRYLHPVTRDIRAVCRPPDDEAWTAFMRCFEEKRKARIRLHVTVEEDGRVCLDFEGEYVALA